jgi:hypothetical protein
MMKWLTSGLRVRGGQYGDKTNMTTGSSAGTHFAGGGAATHNCPPSDERHEGDMVRPGDACKELLEPA